MQACEAEAVVTVVAQCIMECVQHSMALYTVYSAIQWLRVP